MKRTLSLMLALSVVCTLCACGSPQKIDILPTENLQTDSTESTNLSSTESTNTSSTENTNNATDNEPELTKTASITYNHVSAEYSDMIIYKDGPKFGVLNNDGSICIPAIYDYIRALDENHIQFQQGDTRGILLRDGKVILEGNYYDFDYLGASYVIAETAIPCSADDYWDLQSSEGYYQLKYQLFSLATKTFVDDVDLSSFSHLSRMQCKATENNLLIVSYIPSTQSNAYWVYYFATKQWVELDSLLQWKENGYIIWPDKTILDSCGNTAFDFAKLGLTGVLSKSGFENFYFGLTDSNCILINNSGERLFYADQNAYNDAEMYNGYIIIRKDGYYGVIDSAGNTVIPFQYDAVFHYFSNIYAVRMNKYWGFIDTQGNTLLEPTIKADYYHDHYFKIDFFDDTKSIINPYTGETHEYQYLSVLDENKGIFKAKNGNGWAIVTPEYTLTDFVYESIAISEDCAIYSGQKGNTYDFFTLN